MIFNKLFCVCVIFLTITSSFSQLIDQGTETTDVPTIEEATDVICKKCVCTDTFVNCANMNITEPFELSDWEGLANFKPSKVDLSRNQLTSISRIAKLPIQILNLSNCDISNIEDASFFYLDEIRTIDLSRNKISTSDLSRKAFCGPLDTTLGPQNYKYIQELNLAYNDIHSLPQDLFGFMITLTTLDLSGNPLAYIDQITMGALTDLINLRTLKLSGCELEVLPEGLLRRQRKLSYLDLSDNRFTTIPSVLQEATRLTYLNLDKNAIQAIEGTNSLATLVKLRELSLCRMSRLQNITAGALGGFTNLKIFRMTHNPRLTNLDPAFLVSKDEDDEEQWPIIKELINGRFLKSSVIYNSTVTDWNLEVAQRAIKGQCWVYLYKIKAEIRRSVEKRFYLNNNNLSRISSHYLDNWNDLLAADFSNNPYVCDCNSQWMVDVLTPLMNNTPQNNTISNMVCKKPADLRGLTFAQLNSASKTLVCAESENITEQATVSNLAIILGIMIGIIVTFPLVLILVLLWRKGYFARCRKTRKQSYTDYYEEENDHL